MGKKNNEISIRQSDLNGALEISISDKRTSYGCDYCGSSDNVERLSFFNRDYDICSKCRSKRQTELSPFIKIDTKETWNKLQKKHDSRKKRKESKIRKELGTVSAKARPYLLVGLPETFAMAIARNPQASNSILDLWEARSGWWKQYEPSDPMITCVLNGRFTEAEAKWMDSFRSDHEDLVWAVLNGSVTTEWTRALLESGFEGNIGEVSAALDGGSPGIIARISKIDVLTDKDGNYLVPPQLDSPANCSEPDITVPDTLLTRPEEIQLGLMPDDPDLWTERISEVSDYITNLTEDEANSILKGRLGLQGSKLDAKEYLEQVVLVTADCANGKGNLSKNTKIKKVASKLRIRDRTTMQPKSLKTVINRKRRQVVKWVEEILPEE